VDERRGLERMPGAFTAHVLFRQPAQFAVNQRYQLIHRCLIAFAPGQEKSGNFVWIWLWHLTATPDWRALRKTFPPVAGIHRKFRMD
jgi:hypothetical protein